MSTKKPIHFVRASQTKGQVSLFLVFLFQVLFVFFAMVVNVGLLVYYKINLQNSVDLAAYYAAMKQSEMLNTIGHINYQIRQSWKLLAYRATILGTLGPDQHPARPLTVNGNSFKAPPSEVIYGSPGEPKMPVFCITIAEIYANPLGIGGSGPVVLNETDNQCRDDTNHQLSGFKIPDVIWALPGFNETIHNGAIALQNQFLNEFAGGGFRNYNTLASIISHFRADSLNRRKVIGVIANTMSQSRGDFSDIEGFSVSQGAQKVLQKNLAEQNKAAGLIAELYNSLADANCGGPNSDIELLPGWLKEIEVVALYAYMDSIIKEEVFDGPGKAGQGVRFIGFANDSLPSDFSKLTPGSEVFKSLQEINALLTQAGLPDHGAGRWTTAVGVEKNPWCMPYVGFKATSNPKLPFMPARFSPKLQAKAFAKPFGSRIGPWYGKTWPDRTASSTSDKNINVVIDKRLPPRMFEGATSAPSLGPNDKIRFFPNYSRFVGDTLGLLSQRARWAFGKYYWAPRPDNPFWTSMWKQPWLQAFAKNREDTSPFFMGPPSGDILADPYQPAYFPLATLQASRYAREMRISELAAVAPDLFDITYYSIEPRFNQHTLPRLTQFIAKFNSKRPGLMVRGDLGWRHPDFATEAGLGDATANIENHITLFKGSDFFTKTAAQIFQIIASPDQLLTSWAETSIIDYEPSTSAAKIGVCNSGARVPAGDDNPWTPGACASGGRTGYSVKLVSKKFLNNTIPDIGGTGVSGTILNLPDSAF
jgi:hypothetical protein